MFDEETNRRKDMDMINYKEDHGKEKEEMHWRGWCSCDACACCLGT